VDKDGGGRLGHEKRWVIWKEGKKGEKEESAKESGRFSMRLSWKSSSLLHFVPPSHNQIGQTERVDSRNEQLW